MRSKMIFLLVAGLLCYAITFSQLTQTTRGTVTYQLLQTPLAGPTVIITGTNKKVVADSLGKFRIPNVAAGTYNLIIPVLNYKVEW